MPGLLKSFQEFIRRFRRLFSSDVFAGGNPHAASAATAAGTGKQTANSMCPIHELEANQRYDDVIRLCETAVDGSEPAEVNLALSRSHYELAARGDELHAWPALLAALDGIEKRCVNQPDVAHAVGICRWVLDHFSDTHRIDVRGFSERWATQRRSTMNESRMETAAPLAELVDLPRLDPSQLADPVQSRAQVQLGNALLEAAPSVLRHGREKPWVDREVRYLSANLATIIAGEKSAEFLAAADYPLPGGHNAQHYEQYLLTAAWVRRQQLQAQTRQVPSIILTALPKSASEFLCYSLAEVTGAAIARLTVGDPFLGTVYARWAAKANQGGCITHDHFAASALNLSALRAGQIERIVVLVRDPRAACWSYETMISEWEKPAPADRMTCSSFCKDVQGLSQWIDTWIQAKTAGFPVVFVKFKDLTANPAKVMSGILKMNGAARFIPSLQEVLRRRQEQKRLSCNFRRGDDEVWRGQVPFEWQARIWEMISPEVRDLLDLKP